MVYAWAFQVNWHFALICSSQLCVALNLMLAVGVQYPSKAQHMLIVYVPTQWMSNCAQHLYTNANSSSPGFFQLFYMIFIHVCSDIILWASACWLRFKQLLCQCLAFKTIKIGSSWHVHDNQASSMSRWYNMMWAGQKTKLIDLYCERIKIRSKHLSSSNITWSVWIHYLTP